MGREVAVVNVGREHVDLLYDAESVVIEDDLLKIRYRVDGRDALAPYHWPQVYKAVIYETPDEEGQ